MIEIVILGISTGCFSAFVDECLEEGMILHWYYKLLVRFAELEPGEAPQNVPFWFKPLGGCAICFNFWLSVGAFILWLDYAAPTNLILVVFAFVMFVGLSFAALSLLLKIVK